MTIDSSSETHKQIFTSHLEAESYFRFLDSNENLLSSVRITKEGKNLKITLDDFFPEFVKLNGLYPKLKGTRSEIGVAMRELAENLGISEDWYSLALRRFCKETYEKYSNSADSVIPLSDRVDKKGYIPTPDVLKLLSDTKLLEIIDKELGVFINARALYWSPNPTPYLQRRKPLCVQIHLLLSQ